MNLKILLPFEIFARRRPTCRASSPKPARDRSVCCRTGSIAWRRLCREFSLMKPNRGRHGLSWRWMKACWSRAGADVLVSVRHAIGGTDLGQLHDAVKREFLTMDEQERRCSHSGRQDGERL